MIIGFLTLVLIINSVPVKGVYKSDTATMIISAGLGDSTFLPRINNSPELVIIDVK